MRKVIAVLAAGSAMAWATPVFARCDPGELVIKFAHTSPAFKHPKGIAARILAARVNEEMDGKVCMQVFPKSTLYGDDDLMPAMLRGDVQIGAQSLSKLEDFTKKFRLFDLPFVFRDFTAAVRYQKSQHGQKLLKSMEDKGILGLAYWHNGMKQMSATRPLLMPADVKGLKFRVQPSDVLMAQFQALGAIPQKMSMNKVYNALKKKIVDGQENTWSNIYSRKFFSVQDGTTETNHGIVTYLIIVSSKWWAELKPDVRGQLVTILRQVTDARNIQANNLNVNAMKTIIRAGGKVRKLTGPQRGAWQNAMKPVWQRFEADIGDDTIRAALMFSAIN